MADEPIESTEQPGAQAAAAEPETSPETGGLPDGWQSLNPIFYAAPSGSAPEAAESEPAKAEPAGPTTAETPEQIEARVRSDYERKQETERKQREAEAEAEQVRRRGEELHKKVETFFGTPDEIQQVQQELADLERRHEALNQQALQLDEYQTPTEAAKQAREELGKLRQERQESDRKLREWTARRELAQPISERVEFQHMVDLVAAADLAGADPKDVFDGIFDRPDKPAKFRSKRDILKHYLDHNAEKLNADWQAKYDALKRESDERYDALKAEHEGTAARLGAAGAIPPETGGRGNGREHNLSWYLSLPSDERIKLKRENPALVNAITSAAMAGER